MVTSVLQCFPRLATRQERASNQEKRHGLTLMREVGAEDGGLGIAAAELHLDLDGAAVWWVVGVHFLAILRADHLPTSTRHAA